MNSNKLTNEFLSQIEIQAKDILLSLYPSLDQVDLPLDLEKIADSLGLVINMGNFGDRDISGMLIGNEIRVDKNQPYPRMAFTIAHEIGHYVLEGQKRSDIIRKRETLNLEDKPLEETKVDAFAAALLMPRSLIRMYKNKGYSSEDLAKTFGVSYSALKFRLKNLNLDEK